MSAGERPSINPLSHEAVGLPRMLPEELDLDSDILRVLEKIKGRVVEQRLLDVARVGGLPYPPTEQLPERYAVNRLALSEEDINARNDVIKLMMHKAGMSMIEHPLGLIGRFEGSQPELTPLFIMSHTDSVPNGDMYDGTLGVVGGIETVRAIKESGIVPKRPIFVLALTGEESARFGLALFGSRGMFHGLTDKELQACDGLGVTIEEALGPEGSRLASMTFFRLNDKFFPTPHAVIELHVEQSSDLEKDGVDLGIVESIAAPVRYTIHIGDRELEPDEIEYQHKKYLELTVNGKADHSGATPMGEENRADGLVEMAIVLSRLMEEEMDRVQTISVGEIDILSGAINKIPGLTTANIRLAGQSEQQVDEALRLLQDRVTLSNTYREGRQTLFDAQAMELREVDDLHDSQFFPGSTIIPRQLAAFGLIIATRNEATSRRNEHVVGTIGTFSLDSSGMIEMKLDVRGIDKHPRDLTATWIREAARRLNSKHGVRIFFNDLPGNDDPVAMDAGLVKTAAEIIDRYGIGSSKVMFSAAGHDAQNAARAGIPAVMLFCPSRNGGKAHHPDAYSSPEDIEKGVKALAALTMRLAA